MMSANITAASTSCRRTGWSVTSAVSSADRLTSKNACRSRIARYSGSERPACRMNHTGVRSTARAARRGRATVPRGLDYRPWRKGRLPSAGANGRSTTRTPAPSAAPRVELENAGTVPWRDRHPPRLPLARRPRQPDRLGRRAHVAAGARAGRARDASTPACARRSRPAATASRSTSSPSTARGSRSSAARRARPTSTCCRAAATPRAEWPSWVEPTAEARERIAAAHAEGYGVVAGAIEWVGGRGRRRPRSLAPYEPGPGPDPELRARRCSARRCSTGSSWSGSRTSRACPPSPRPADDAWLYDGRIVLEAHPKRRAAGP